MFSPGRRLLHYSSLLILLFIPYTNSCQNFTVQHCTDIQFNFRSISSIKCIQFVPTHYDMSINYAVKNYIIIKYALCFNVQSYDSSSSSILFSNECREQCPDEYCSLFDNQPTTSIINIFYSESSKYELNNDDTQNDILSYDYFLFDRCSSADQTKDILLIVVYVLAGVVCLLTLLVITKYIIAWILKRKYGPEFDSQAYNWEWLLYTLCCSECEVNQTENRRLDDPKVESSNSQLNTPHIGIHTDPSTRVVNMLSSTSNNIQEFQSHTGNSSGSSSASHYHSSSYENNSSNNPGVKDSVYEDMNQEIEIYESVYL